MLLLPENKQHTAQKQFVMENHQIPYTMMSTGYRQLKLFRLLRQPKPTQALALPPRQSLQATETGPNKMKEYLKRIGGIPLPGDFQ